MNSEFSAVVITNESQTERVPFLTRGGGLWVQAHMVGALQFEQD